VKRYWVVGGEYTDTHFREIAGGGSEARYGPFATEAAAEAEWSRRSWAMVDNCNIRFRIVEEAGEPKHLKYWVVGGEYIDTSFHEIIGGGAETWAGPFAKLKDAEAEWSRLSWSHVDNCNARYRIVEAAKPPAR
jgi:hypothetical protein